MITTNYSCRTSEHSLPADFAWLMMTLGLSQVARKITGSDCCRDAGLARSDYGSLDSPSRLGKLENRSE